MRTKMGKNKSTEMQQQCRHDGLKQRVTLVANK